MMKSTHNSQEFSIKDFVVSFGRGQGGRIVTDSAQFLSIGRVSLPKDHSNGKLRCIHFQFKLAVLVGGDEYWGQGNNVYKCIKGLAAVGGPFEDGIFLQ